MVARGERIGLLDAARGGVDAVERRRNACGASVGDGPEFAEAVEDQRRGLRPDLDRVHQRFACGVHDQNLVVVRPAVYEHFVAPLHHLFGRFVAVHRNPAADTVAAGIHDRDARIVKVGDIGRRVVGEVDVTRRDDPFDHSRDAESRRVDDIDRARIVHHDVSASFVEGHRLGDVAQFHAVRADEDFVFDAPCRRIVERQRSVVPAEVALARDEHAALRLRKRLFMQRSVVHAGAAESCAGA